MALGELSTLMKTDYEKLNKVIATAGEIFTSSWPGLTRPSIV